MFSALVLLGGCSKDKAGPMSQEIHLATFGLKVKAASAVVLTEGPTQKVELRGGNADVLRQLRTDVDNDNTWKVEFDGNVPDQDRMTIEVTMPRLRRLILTGPSAVRGMSPFTFSDVSIVNTGSGGISLGLMATILNTEEGLGAGEAGGHHGPTKP